MMFGDGGAVVSTDFIDITKYPDVKLIRTRVPMALKKKLVLKGGLDE